MERRVVVTGIGPVTSIGIGKKAFFDSILNMNTCIRSIPEAYDRRYRFKSRHYVPAPEISLAEFGIAGPLKNLMEEAAKISVAGTKVALEDAGFSLREADRCFRVDGMEDSAVIIGVGMSSMQTALHSYLAHMSDGEGARWGDGGKALRYNRMAIPMLMPNSAAAWISILFGMKGSSYTVNASCASGSFAIGEAWRKIREGCCEAAVTGGVEVLAEESGAIMRGFDMLTTLTRAEDGRPMPFSKQRSGFLFNEGAGCILVLEELERARRRGACIYAEILDYACNSDAYNIAQMEPSGRQVAALLETLARGRKIDYINAHGTGTVLNDEIEARAIQTVFGDRASQPFINSTKGILGHSIGASGALEAAVTVLSMRESKIHGNLTEDPLDNLNLPVKTLDAGIDYAISTSYGFGGHNAAILFKRYSDDA